MGTTVSKTQPSTEKNEKGSSLAVSGETAAMILQRLSLKDADASEALSISQLDSWESSIKQDPARILARTALNKLNINDVLLNPSVAHSNSHIYNTVVPHESVKVTNQKSSGRCWLFASTNVGRRLIVEKYNLEDGFELSQAYLYAYDTLEKANYFLENMIDLADKPLDDRVVSYLFSEARNDGGQIDLAVNLIEKYGLVPKAIYNESFTSSNTSKMNSILSSKLRKHALELRQIFVKAYASIDQSLGSSKSMREKRSMAISTTRKRKSEQMQEIYTVVTLMLGELPKADEPFTWQFYDKNKKFHSLTATPLEFYKSSGFTAASWISLIHDPRNEPYKLYTVERLGNVAEGRKVLYVNLKMSDIEDAIVSMLKAGQPVWFGCDVGAQSNTALGCMDLDVYDYPKAFGFEVALDMSKAERLQTGESAMTHAMVISGVHLDDKGKAVRYRVENSWGVENVGEQGYFWMTAAWAREYLYQVAIPKNMVAKRVRDIFEAGNPVELPAYDPFGALA